MYPKPQLSKLLSMVSVCFVHVHLPSKAFLAWKSLSPLCVCVISGKVKPPVDLTETLVDGVGHLLSWKNPYPASSNIAGTLVYQLQYRRHMHDWTVSTHKHTQSTLSGTKKIIITVVLYLPQMHISHLI